MSTDQDPQDHAASITTRVFAASVLIALLSLAGVTAREVSRAATDSWVAPVIFSPDNDAVISNKVQLAQLQAERDRTAAAIDNTEADLAAGARALARLQALAEAVRGSLSWTSDVNRRLAESGAREVKTLDEQGALLATMIEHQEHLVAEASANLRAGLIAAEDHEREVMTLNQLRVSLLENQRNRNERDVQMQQVQLAHDSLAHRGHAPAMPERILREDQLVRVELETLKLAGEQRSRESTRRLDRARLAQIDELAAQLSARPIFRAIRSSLDLAFVPYTQIDGVSAGAEVHRCLWGLLLCRPVGTIAEVVPGEVVLPDPWGNPTRGQYAILTLSDRSAAKAKTLRVRSAR
jgi:hypothetical protein